MSNGYKCTLSQRIDSLIAESRRRGSRPRPDEVERLYTDGCAEVLVLEAELLRTERRLAAARAGAHGHAPPADEIRTLADRRERVEGELDTARSRLRQLRAALEWAQSGAQIEQRIGFDRPADGHRGGPR